MDESCLTGNSAVNAAIKDLRDTDDNQYIITLVQLVLVQRFCTLFRTKNRHLGYAIGDFREGDEVVVLDGAGTVHLIRKVDNSLGGMYKLVGVAYVHGMMNGEVESLGLHHQGVVLV